MLASDESIDMEKLVEKVVEIAKGAGQILKSYHNVLLTIQTKNDNTPLTEADTKAHLYIAECLSNLQPNIPVLSEESSPIPDYAIRKNWQKYWLIDPLDGTKSFIKGEEDFVVSIALIENHMPVLGVIYVPMMDICYYAVTGKGAYKTIMDQDLNKAIKLFCQNNDKDEVKITMGSSKPLSERLLSRLEKAKPYVLLRTSSALKFCQVAEGAADVYLRLYPTYEWDTAAGQCILAEAGGKLIDLEKETILSYNRKACLLNPYFIAGMPWAIERLKMHL